MRKIVNNRVYDTSSAHKVGEYESEVDGGSYVFGGLYRKRHGELTMDEIRNRFGSQKVETEKQAALTA